MTHGTTTQRATLRLDGAVLRCAGEWTALNLAPLEARLEGLAWPPGDIHIELGDVRRLDIAGAWLLHRLQQGLARQGHAVSTGGLAPQAQHMLELVRRTGVAAGEVPRARRPGLLEGVGRGSLEQALHTLGLLAFVGELSAAWLRQLLHPAQVRWRQVAHELGEAGYKALGVVGLLSFLLGVVIAYQGGVQLHKYAASLYVADLVGLSMVRELAPMIAAIIVAGRTGSAYTAQIGTMKVTEEIDALRAMGIAPMELLVLPKLLALVIALPLLTVYADIMGILGGMVMAGAQLGVTFPTFVDRLGVALTTESTLLGIGKTPVFAAIIATLGCYQGFQVVGSAESVGRRTTLSVVQSIVAVIVVDAAFSVAFSYLGL